VCNIAHNFEVIDAVVHKSALVDLCCVSTFLSRGQQHLFELLWVHLRISYLHHRTDHIIIIIMKSVHVSNISALFLCLQQGQLIAMGDRNRTLRIYDVTRLRPDDETSLETCCVLDKINAHEVSMSQCVCHHLFLN